MPNSYRNPEKRDKPVCGISDDDNDADDYENVIDNRIAPALPERSKAAKSKTTGQREDLQLRYMDKPLNSVARAGNTAHVSGQRTVPPFQPPTVGLDVTSPAVNAAFRDQAVEQTSKKKHTWKWKKMGLIFCLALMFLFWFLLTSIIYIYYSNLSNQLAELKNNASQIQDPIKKEKLSRDFQELWKEDLIKVNQTLMTEMAVLKSEIWAIKRFLGHCISCPAGWTLLSSRCYFLSASHQTWGNSQNECKKVDSALLVLNNKQELDALRPLIGSKRFWIGLRRDNRNIWRWVDGTTLQYTNWNSGEPNNAAQQEHCTEMIAGGWNDLDCSRTIDYICSKLPTC